MRSDRDFPTQELDTHGVLRRLLSDRHRGRRGREVGELRVIDHPKANFVGHSYPLIEGLALRIGRSAHAEVSFPSDTSMSRLHARLVASRDGIVIEDLESTNGLLVNDLPAGRVSILGHEDRIRIGKVEFRVISPTCARSNRKRWSRELDARLAARRNAGSEADLHLLVIEVHAMDRLEATFGGAATDEVRSFVTQEAERATGPDAFVGRVGGASLCVVLPSTATPESLVHATAELRRTLEQVTLDRAGAQVTFRCTVQGRAFSPPYPPTGELLAAVVAPLAATQ